MFISSIICALFGFIWDVSLHIGNGRDDGALANPAHYFILIGLFGIFVAGCTAMVLPLGEDARPGPAAVRITDDWYAPVGGIVMAGCGLYALMGFPLDDVWHRIFGQDVTLWGPTHLMMIGGAGFSTLAALYLEHEGRKVRTDDTPPDGIGLKFVQYLAFAGVLIGAVGLPDRVRLRCAAVPAGVRAHADRRRRRARLGGRTDLHGPGCRPHRRGRRHRSARDRRLPGSSRTRRAGQLVPPLPRGRHRRRTARA